MLSRVLLALCLYGGSFAASLRAEELPRLHLRVAGGMSGTVQYDQLELPFWTKRIPSESDGRITAEIAKMESLGVKATDIPRLMTNGTLTFGTLITSALSAADPELGGMDLAGMNPEIGDLFTAIDRYLPVLSDVFAKKYGIKILAAFHYPAQLVFCNRPIAGLRDLSGKRVRVASVQQSDLIDALGGSGLVIPFAEMTNTMRKGAVDCAITAASSAHAVGLTAVTTHVLEMPINWGPYLFAVNARYWDGLPQIVREFLTTQLQVLELEMRHEAALQSRAELDCVTGADVCRSGPAGHLKLVRSSPDDERLRRRMLLDVVAPRWARRCGFDCYEAWRVTAGQALDFDE